jgi:hypothetical protein
MSAGNCFGENVHQYVTFVNCYIFLAFFKTISATNYISAYMLDTNFFLDRAKINVREKRKEFSRRLNLAKGNAKMEKVLLFQSF